MGLGEATIVTLEYLDSLKDDKACPVCYHAYLRKFVQEGQMVFDSNIMGLWL